MAPLMIFQWRRPSPFRRCWGVCCSRGIGRRWRPGKWLWGWFTFTTLYDTRLPLFSEFAPITWYRWRFVSKVILMTLVTVGMLNTWSRLRLYLLVTAGRLGFLVLKAVPF